MFMNRSIDDATDICLVSPIASRKHAIIVHRGDENVEIKDLNTINGTFLNGKKIKQNVWVPLKNNDVLSKNTPTSLFFFLVHAPISRYPCFLVNL